MNAGNAEPDRQAERELRVLLERAVPQASAPHDRMAQIRRRVRRRRRRRAAAGAMAVLGGVTAVVAAALLRPVDPATPGDVLPAASPSRAVPAPGFLAPTPTPTPTRTPGTDSSYALVRIDALSGLRLKLSGTGWTSLATRAPDGLVTGFVGAQPLQRRDRCTKQELISYAVCPPVDKVAEGGVLISFQQIDDGTEVSVRPGRFTVKGMAPASEGCRELGGRHELTGWGTEPDGTSSVGLMVRACFSRPEQGTVEAVTASLKGAVYGSPSR
ncbi:hypothetical protein PV392_22880 [Streptomyces sp. ME03-5709C]|nr:hypothetical protein [Streptomyces sp. ME03-5709C]